jgi:hypothetical protein
MKKLAFACMTALAVVPFAHAGVIESARQAQAETWTAWGGEIGIRWNPDLMVNMGLSLEAPSGKIATQDPDRHDWFELRESAGLEFHVANASLKQFTGGSLQMRGGYVLRLPDGDRIDLRNLTLRVRASDPKILDIVSGDGKAWFYSDRVMFEMADEGRTLAIRAADVVMSEALAQRIGMPEAAGWELADMALNTEVNVQGSGAVINRMCNPYPWPGVAVPNDPGEVYQADLFMDHFSIQPVGCQSCSGPTGAQAGIAAFAPSSTLKNNVNDGSISATIPGDPLGTSSALYTADVAWYTKFSGNSPPYNNDQHPFLIWNLYRIDADGSIRQIGRSGVKHAFLTVNSGCISQCGGSHALGLGCGDTYGVGNNDSPSSMGPRSEIIAGTGQWGRCGSIYDSDCNGDADSSGNDSWTQRMKVPERWLVHSGGDGSSFLFESWYVARDDINIYNSMATKSVNPQYSGSQWTLSGETNYRLGPAIDRWVDPADPGANEMSTEIANSGGHTKVAVKVVDLGNGKWRYNYAVMNLDFARAITEGSEPNLRVVSNAGFDAFSVPVPSGATIYAPSMSTGEANPNANWRFSIGDGEVTWNTDTSIPGVGDNHPPVAVLPTLDWGTMYTFSFIADTAPTGADASLHVAEAGSPSSYEAATLVPSCPRGLSRGC